MRRLGHSRVHVAYNKLFKIYGQAANVQENQTKVLQDECDICFVKSVKYEQRTAGEYSQFRRLNPNREILNKSEYIIYYLSLFRKIVS